ncbi:acyltransferase family protein [Enterobacter roggenkampii]|jgi:peptidoglycan/LPS O-acetylase OafA/YrhL|uniref:acyltransferase family protein n=1 Tax=Enterobacter roggenkampii TaxID=1812935 RepID=UPI0020056D96|nr:acyltransferase family protein [Enterobacter roggenkampii]EKY4018616.1 acyltransferase [Enterobacter roggenkampii]MCK7367562.1 acyltransferase [Enterobacter roggenkampii]URR09945.1 acyltransferase [Enterobacter roggenkampii]
MIKYRADIDGLRSIAVLSVVLFHFFPLFLQGGFVGVDIFFVISGFLIGKIIISEIKENSFSFINFYKRRALRIFPALILVLGFSFFIGYSTLYEPELASLSKHIAAGSGFVSNLVLWSESGYFDASSNAKPLLHLWSLGVEEQFYIFTPIILIFAIKRGIPLLKVLVTLMLASFIYCLWSMHFDRTANYYSPFSRMWELMAGVMLAFINISMPHANAIFKRFGNYISLAGMLLLSLSVLFINESMKFPGYIAVFPVLGSMMIIAAGQNSHINSKILSAKPLVFIGLISYPLYLWHWPVVTFARIIHGDKLSTGILFVLLAVSFALAFLTYVLVEKPIRFMLPLKSEHKAIILSIGLLSVFSLGITVFLNNGIHSRQFTSINAERSTGYDPDIPFTADGCGISKEDEKIVPFCQHDRRGRPSYALIGDSKSMALYGGVMRTAIPDNYWMYLGGNSSSTPPRIVMPVFTNDSRYSYYQDASRVVIDGLADNDDVKVVVYAIASRAIFQLKSDDSIADLPETKNYRLAIEGLLKGVDKLVLSGKKVVFVIDNPTLAHPESCMGRNTTFKFINEYLSSANKNCSISVNEQLRLSDNYRKLLEDIKNRYPSKVYTFETIDFMCDKGICSHRKNGHFMYSETDHISGYASGMIGNALNKFLLTIK